MEMPKVYTVEFHMDLHTPPLEIVRQIEVTTHPNAVLHLQAYYPDNFAISTVSESAFNKLCEDGFTMKNGQKVSVSSALKNVRGVLIKTPRTVKKYTLTRKLKKFGKVFFPKCATDPHNEQFVIWSLIVAFKKNIPKCLSIGGEEAIVLVQT